MDPDKPLSAEAPEEGVYDDIPDETYHAWDAASNSRCSKIREEAEMGMVYDVLNPSSSDAMDFGSMVHDRVLIPEVFAKRYMKEPPVPKGKTRNVKEYKDAVKEMQAANPKRVIVKLDDWFRGECVEENLYSHDTAGPILRQMTGTERSMVFLEPSADQLVKCRMDIDVEPLSMFGDLKMTAKGLSDEALEKLILFRGYHRQAAFYQGGAHALGIKRSAFVFIFCDPMPPHDVVVKRIREDALDVAFSQIVPLLKRYKQARESGFWPGRSGRIEDISLPHWGLKSEAA